MYHVRDYHAVNLEPESGARRTSYEILYDLRVGHVLSAAASTVSRSSTAAAARHFTASSFGTAKAKLNGHAHARFCCPEAAGQGGRSTPAVP